MDVLNFFKVILQSDAGSFGSVVVLFGLAFYLTSYITKKITQFENKISNIASVDAKIENFNTKIETKFDRIDNKYESIKEDIHIIKAFIEILKDKGNPLAQRRSPVSLSEMGIKVNEEIGANKIINNHWSLIEPKVNSQLQDDCNPYDIQVASFKVADKYQEIITKEELDLIKNHAFNIGYDLDTYNLLFGIIIRDKILNTKGFKIADIDKFDPSKAK